jgi:Negative regulator of sigma F
MKAEVLRFAQTTPAPTRAEVTLRRLLVAAAAAIWSTGVMLAINGVRIAPRPVWLVLATGLVSALVSAAVLFTAATRGRLMLGRSARTLGAVVLGAPVLLLAWKIGITACADGMSDAWPLRPGTRCLSVSLLSGVGPFVALLWARRRSVTDHARWTGAALGVAAGSVGWVVNDLRCQVGYWPHLLLGHLLPIGVFAAIGVLAADLLSPRWIQPR